MSPHLASTQHGRDREAPIAFALVASGNEWFGRSLESILGAQGMRVLRAQAAEDAFAKAATSHFHAILLDAELPDSSGLALCTQLRAMTTVGASTPIILLRPRPWRREERFEALRAGAWECIGIPADSEELLLHLATFVAAKKAADAALDRGLVDPATGAYNASGIMRRVNELGSDAVRYSRPIGCVALSTRAAFAAADRASDNGPELEPAIELLRKVSRASDVVGRIGPAEFAVIAPNAGPEGTLRLARRLLDATDSLPTTSGEPMKFRAGYFAVDDLRATALEPSELVHRAATALRQTFAAPDDLRLCAYSSELTASQN